MIDELVHAGRENLDLAHVARYDAKMDSDAAAEVALLVARGMTQQSVVVDLGAGTGQFSVAVAPVCGRVVAVDVSPPMLARLEAKAAALGLANLEVARAGFLTYQHAGDPADVVYTRFALHHLPDFWKVLVLRHLRSVLRPGGLLRLWDVVYDFDPADAADRIDAWCATGGDEVQGEWSRDELAEHIRDEHSTFSWLLEAMIIRSGFGIVEVERSPDGFESKYLLRAA